jgi:hypothetical protein
VRKTLSSASHEMWIGPNSQERNWVENPMTQNLHFTNLSWIHFRTLLVIF